jgi:hypothetical protein
MNYTIKILECQVGPERRSFRWPLRAYLLLLLPSMVFEGALPVLLPVVVGLPIFIYVILAPWGWRIQPTW